jgi:acyl-CoA synthetase (AMP-forming)/AMP-acid ligase II
MTQPLFAVVEDQVWPGREPESLVELFAWRADTPDLRAFKLVHHAPGPEPVDWGDLWTGARIQAARLRRAGLRRGDTVLLIFPTCRQFVELFIGVMLAGGIPVPAAPPMSLRSAALSAHQALLGTIARDANAAFCVIWPRLVDIIRASLVDAVPSIRVLSGTPANAEESPLDQRQIHTPAPGDVAFLQYTSGSTSAPKGIELTHANLLANMRGIWSLIGTPDTAGVSWLPLHHDMGLIGSLLTPFWAGRPVTLMPPSAFVRTPVAWLRAISDDRATSTVAPNFAFSLCLKSIRPEQMENVRLDSLRVALNGAEPVDPEAVRRFEERFAPYGLARGTVRPVYGLAESSLAVTFSDPGSFVVDEIDSDALENERLAVPLRSGRNRAFISVGRAIPGSRVAIFDDGDRPLPERRIGQIVVRGPSVMRGYVRQPEETATALAGGWLHTGDLGYLADGLLFITGRSKDLIIRYGKNYYPNDIEAEVMRVPGVTKGSSAVFSIEERGTVVVVVVAESRESDDAAVAAIAAGVRERVSDAFLFTPDEVLIVPRGTVPRTTSGKVRRQECRRRFLSGELLDDGSPRATLVKSVLRSWRLRLGSSPTPDVPEDPT